MFPFTPSFIVKNRRIVPVLSSERFDTRCANKAATANGLALPIMGALEVLVAYTHKNSNTIKINTKRRLPIGQCSFT